MLDQFEMDVSYCCTQCSHQAVWQFQLDNHFQRNHNVFAVKPLFHAITEPERYSCFSCGFQTYYKLSQYEHLISRECATNYTDKTDQSCKELEEYLCDHCKDKGHSSLILVKHVDSCKIDKVAKPMLPSASTTVSEANAENSMTILYRNHCPYKSKYKSNSKNHLIQHASGDEVKWFDCTHCSYRTKRKGNVRKHNLSKHAGPDAISWFHCAKCSYRSMQKRHLQMHMMKHLQPDEAEWFNCTQCSYRAKLSDYLKRHMTMHDRARADVEWFSCTECSFQTKLRGSLRRHMLYHAVPEEINWVSCAKCSYRCKTKATLKRHMLTHGASDDDWFSCTKCAFRTIRKGYLKTHMKTHANDDEIDWLSCPECSYRVKHQVSLMKQLLKHAGAEKTWFNCVKCSFRTEHKVNLRRHLATQHKDADIAGSKKVAAIAEAKIFAAVTQDKSAAAVIEGKDVTTSTEGKHVIIAVAQGKDYAAVAQDKDAAAVAQDKDAAAVAQDKDAAAVAQDKDAAAVAQGKNAAAKQIRTGRRPREPDTSIVLRTAIVGMSEQGKSISEIARTFGKSRACVRHWIRRAKEGGIDGLTTLTTGRGRPRITTQAEDEVLVEMAIEQPSYTAIAIQQQASIPCSRWTVRRRLKEAKKSD